MRLGPLQEGADLVGIKQLIGLGVDHVWRNSAVFMIYPSLGHTYEEGLLYCI